MKVRNREINIFSLSLMDVISGAMGAFLIVMVIQARFTAIDEGNDPEKLRPRLDAAMEALASIRAGTEKTIANRFETTVKPGTLGLSGGETVPEITAMGRALRADIDTIDKGFADALDGRVAAVDALANASAGTEDIFKKYMGGDKPGTQGLKRGKSVSEIEKLGQALRSDIGELDKGIDLTLQARTAAMDALAAARTGTEKIFKDRIGAKPATQGLRVDYANSAPENRKLGQALRSDIDTIYKELRKGKESVSDTPFVVSSAFQCGGGYAFLIIASDETNPSTGKPWPQYFPPREKSNPNYGVNGQQVTQFPGVTYMNRRPVTGRHYKIYLDRFTSPCEGVVIMLGGREVVTKGAFGNRIPQTELREREKVNLSWPRDSIVSRDGKRYGVYFVGTISVDKSRNISFSRASEKDRDAEMKAMAERMGGTHRPVQETTQYKKEEKNDRPPLTREAALAAIDNLPVPRDMPSCAEMHNVANRTLNQLQTPQAQRNAVLNEVLIDCSMNRFQDAQKKLKAAMKRLVK